MAEGTNFKRLYIGFFIFVGAVVYVRSHYTTMNVLEYSKEHRHPAVSPKVDYYIGRMQYHRSRYPESHKAFDQLLTSYPTCQYAPDALYYKGLMYQEDRVWEYARQMYIRYKEEFPEGNKIRQVENKYEFVKFK